MVMQNFRLSSRHTSFTATMTTKPSWNAGNNSMSQAGLWCNSTQYQCIGHTQTLNKMAVQGNRIVSSHVGCDQNLSADAPIATMCCFGTALPCWLCLHTNMPVSSHEPVRLAAAAKVGVPGMDAQKTSVVPACLPDASWPRQQG